MWAMLGNLLPHRKNDLQDPPFQDLLSKPKFNGPTKFPFKNEV